MAYFPGVFLASSVAPSDVIPQYRHNAKTAILEAHMMPVMFEYYKESYSSGSPLALSRKMIDISDIFVGIYTGIYGKDIHDGKDWAEFEFDYALEQNKPMLIFLSTSLPDSDEKFQQFRQKFSNIFFHTFHDASDLQTQLTRLLLSTFGTLTDKRIPIEPLFGQPEEHHRYKADIFMIMPFRKHLNKIYEECIKPTVKQANLSIKRGDNFFETKSIMTDIWSATYHSKAVIAECTEQNANVFYEIGIAHTLGKKFILLTQDEKYIPFDLRHYRYFVYSPDNLAALKNYLMRAFEEMDLK